MSTATKKKPRMVQFNMKLPQEVVDRLEKRAKKMSRGSIVVRPVAVARDILREHA